MRLVVRVAMNVEQLLYRSPGGVGRYTAQVAGPLAEGAGSHIMPFCARHPRSEVERAAATASVSGPVRSLALPRAVLYEAWHSPGPGLWGPPVADADVVHAPSPAVPPRRRVPLVVTVHDAAPVLYPEAFPPRGLRFHRRGLAAAAARADLVVTSSHAAAEEIAAHTAIDADRLRVVAHGVDPPVHDPRREAQLRAARGLGDRPYVLWVGSLEPRKNVGTLVAAMARLRSGSGSGTGPRAGGAGGRPALVLAGYQGWLHDGLVPAGARAALGDDLVETGRVGEEELWALYGGAAVVALPSRHEGWGYPAVEAMSRGVPVVASDIPALREVTGGAAVLVGPDDIDGWGAAIEGLLVSPQEAELHRARGLVRAGGLRVADMVAATAEVYREVLGR